MNEIRQRTSVWVWARVLGVVAAVCVFLPLRTRASGAYSSSYIFSLDGFESSGWENSITVDQYNPSWDTDPLLRIDFILEVTLTGTIGAENLDSQAQTLEAVFGTTVSLTQSGRVPVTIVSASPSYSTTISLAGYDETTDYGGTSGATFSASDAESASHTSPPLESDLTAFTGTGILSLGITAAGSAPQVEVTGDSVKIPPGSTLTAPGISGTLTVVYHTPEPASALLMGVFLLAIACRRRRRS